MAPLRVRPPWLEGASGWPGQSVDRAPNEGEWTAWRRCVPPLEELGTLLAGPWTDLALELGGASLDPLGRPDRALLSWMRRLDRANQGQGDAHRRRLWLRLDEASPERAARVLSLCRALGVHAVHLVGPAAAHGRALEALVPRLLWSEEQGDV